MLRQYRPKQLAKAPFDPVAHYSIANLLGNCDAVALSNALIRVSKQDERRLRNSQAAIRSEEVGAFAHDRNLIAHTSTIRKTGPEMEPA